MQNEAIFEAPASHEGHPEFEHPEMHEYEYEDETNPYASPEYEYEWEASGESNPELGSILGGIARSFLGGEEIGHEMHEMHEHPEMHEMHEFHEVHEYPEMHEYEYEFEYEDESDRELGAILGNIASSLLGEAHPEFESQGEADQFFGKIKNAIKRVAKTVAPIAKMVAPIAFQALSSMGPYGMIAGQLMNTLVREAEMEVAQMENHFISQFAQNEVVAETGHNEAVHEAALTELLAAQAAEAQTESEAEAAIAATLPITIRIMGATRLIRPVVPVLAQSNARLVPVLRRRNRHLPRAIPKINRVAIGTLRQAARRGIPVTAPLAVQAMSTATRRVLGNPKTVKRAIKRNMALRARTTPPGARRVMVYVANPRRSRVSNYY